ncbi:hypothetical protein Mapa_010889 [Marchantia paleacea]|nr:hypothetical protein Mapa_010889 [Marchantia paleacea]
MDGGRYVLQQAGWDNSSALENYDPIHDSDLRAGGAYGGRGGYLEGSFAREPGFSRDSYQRELLYEREAFGMSPAVLGLWPPAKRRTLEEELALLREVQRHDKVGFVETFRDYGFDRVGRHSRDRDSYDGDDYEYRRRSLRGSREGSRDVDFEFTTTRHRGGGYDSDRERSRREREWRRRKDRTLDRSRSREKERDWSPVDRDRRRERSRSFSYEERIRGRSRSPRSRSRGWREDSYEDAPPRNERRRDREGRSSHHERAPLAPSATLVVKGLSQKTVEDDLYHALAEWGPLRHVRVIKERNSGVSRGFAFVDFPSVEAAQKMMDGAGYDGLVVDGRRLFFEYSSKPTGGVGPPQGGSSGRGGTSKCSSGTGTDWMCTVCACVNFARRTLCFQCNEGRAEDAPAADLPASTAPVSGGRRTSEAGPTHVLVVRGLDENVNEESLHYEFSKYAPIKDLRLVRDKFTHVSRGFAFIHYNSVEEATKALEASNGTALEKNGQVLRVAFAKSIYGPGSSAPGATPTQGSLAAAAAIEAATFAQQYDNVGWVPKEYNPEEDINHGAPSTAHGGGYQSQASQGTSSKGGKGAGKGRGKAPPHEARQGNADAGGSAVNEVGTSDGTEAPQSGFVWDEASGYYFDAASGFYYDGHRGLYYDGNTGIWYTYNQETQQYTQYVDASSENTTDVGTDVTKGSKDEKAGDNPTEGIITSKAVISAPPAVSLELVEKKPTLAEAVAAAAAAAQVSAKKEKERLKEKERESRLAGKGPVMVSKKKITNVMTMWKQRQFEGQGAQGTSDGTTSAPPSATAETANDTTTSATAASSTMTSQVGNSRFRADTTTAKDSLVSSMGRCGISPYLGIIHSSDGMGRAKAASSSQNSGIFSSQHLTTSPGIGNTSLSRPSGAAGRGGGRGMGRGSIETAVGAVVNATQSSDGISATPFRTDASALGSYGPMAGTKRRFTETPQTGYRDRAAERRSLYGSSLPGDASGDIDVKDKGSKGRGLDMPFPPGVGAKSSGANAALAGPEVQSFEVISAEKALDERNVGNRMLRNMGWQEGSGLGKEGTGIVEPVQAHGTGERAGLGSASQRRIDSRFETQPGDTYRVVIQKKALARFHEMI